MKQITQVREDYIRAIYYLQQTKNSVRVIDIANYLGLKKQTVTERVQEMAKSNLVSYKKYGNITLVKESEQLAKKLTRKHRIIEVFLHNVLKRPRESVHEEAHRLEHAFSDQSIRALHNLLHKPKYDPHGQSI